MNCSHIRKRLSLHAGGDLDARAASATDDHLRGCLSCYREFREIRSSLETLRTLRRTPEDAMPAELDFVDSVMAQVENEDVHRRRLPMMRVSFSSGGWIAAAAMVVAAVFIRMDQPAPQPITPLVLPGTVDPSSVMHTPVRSGINRPWEDSWKELRPRVRTTPPLDGLPVKIPLTNLRTF